MEFLLEIIFQLLFETVGDALLELGFRGSAQVLRSKIGRAVIGAAAGFGFGLWWGTHLSDLGGEHRPRLLWVSLAMAAIAAGAALYRYWSDNGYRRDPDQPVIVLLMPWRWPVDRLAAFAVLNAAIAAGIATGWRPPVLG